ncbi:hypothetical protein DPMN_007555 [Dreissena polymorpha]|uniref:Uncharacterized protein n=1 Tax=Dreissena polymorpha TaxID=45954 RepID=A0A9D4MUJ0_DREPO|nr:hypothetical protein DPMN_007555 [Dreissena polymorpha]
MVYWAKEKQSFQWSSKKDQIWIVIKDILCTMLSPVPTGRSNRMFKFDDDSIQSVEQNFQAYMQNCWGDYECGGSTWLIRR